jgi:hypothetical protein
MPEVLRAHLKFRFGSLAAVAAGATQPRSRFSVLSSKQAPWAGFHIGTSVNDAQLKMADTNATDSALPQLRCFSGPAGGIHMLKSESIKVTPPARRVIRPALPPL